MNLKKAVGRLACEVFGRLPNSAGMLVVRILRARFHSTPFSLGGRHGGAMLKEPQRFSRKKMKRIKREQERMEASKDMELPLSERQQKNRPITLYTDRVN